MRAGSNSACSSRRSSKPRAIATRSTPNCPAAAARSPAGCKRPRRNWRPSRSLPRWRFAAMRPGKRPTRPPAASPRPRRQYKAARRRWREALSAAGLPDRIDLKQARRLTRRGDWIAETQHRLAERQEELDRRRRELDSLAARIVQLAADAGVEGTGAGRQGETTRESEHRSVSLLVEPAPTFSRRRPAARRPPSPAATPSGSEARRIRAALAKREEAIGRLKHGRRQLFIEAGVKDEQEFRQRALECGRAEVLRRQREAISPRNRSGPGLAMLGRHDSAATRRQLPPRRWKAAAANSASGLRPSKSNSAACWKIAGA